MIWWLISSILEYLHYPPYNTSIEYSTNTVQSLKENDVSVLHSVCLPTFRFNTYSFPSATRTSWEGTADNHSTEPSHHTQECTSDTIYGQLSIAPPSAVSRPLDTINTSLPLPSPVNTSNTSQSTPPATQLRTWNLTNHQSKHTSIYLAETLLSDVGLPQSIIRRFLTNWKHVSLTIHPFPPITLIPEIQVTDCFLPSVIFLNP